MKRTLLSAAALLCLTLGAAHSQEEPADAMNQRLSFKRNLTQNVRLDYLLSLPPGYQQGAQQWPLILFLHGAGERGTNLSKVSVHGPPKLVKQKKEFPFIIVSPQCPTDEIWNDAALLALLDDVMKNYRVDPRRVYLTGLSMGGFGTWSLGLRHPERFAAIAPICGGGDILPALLTSQEKSKALRSLGVWAFHGAKDPVVALAESERMVAALKKAGVKDLELTVYPEADHDSWTKTYENPKLYEWFLAHQR
jgi:predicted peptidase